MVDLTQDDDDSQEDNAIVRVTIPGHPKSLPRPRFGPSGRGGKRGHYYNPARDAQRKFAKAVKEQVPQIAFPICQRVSMECYFYLRRPNSDFIGRVRKSGKLREDAKERGKVPSVPDTDNLGKFVMDALNGIVYADDRQVTRVIFQKELDKKGTCDGRTEIVVRKL